MFRKIMDFSRKAIMKYLGGGKLPKPLEYMDNYEYAILARIRLSTVTIRTKFDGRSKKLTKRIMAILDVSMVVDHPSINYGSGTNDRSKKRA